MQLFPSSDKILIKRNEKSLIKSLYAHNLNKSSNQYNFRTIAEYKKKRVSIGKLKNFNNIIKRKNYGIHIINFDQMIKNPDKIYNKISKILKLEFNFISENNKKYNESNDVNIMQNFYFLRYLQFLNEEKKFNFYKNFLFNKKYEKRFLFDYRISLMDKAFIILDFLSMKQLIINIFTSIKQN